jgi:tyrosine-protein phosphatase YwqE
MLSFLFKSKKVQPDLSFIGVDMHSHLLPGIDDGLKDLEDTVSFIRELHSLGYHKFICTPHVMSDLYPNTPETILAKLGLVQEALKARDIPVQVEAAAEYMVDTEMEDGIKEGRHLLTFGKNFVLIEMSYLAASPNIEQVIFELRIKNLQPVLAHPERYNFYHSKFDSYHRFIDLGCLMQINLLSLSGYYGKPVKVIAEKLIKNNMVDLLGTDMHHINHLNALKHLASQKEFYKILQDVEIKNKQLFS